MEEFDAQDPEVKGAMYEAMGQVMSVTAETIFGNPDISWVVIAGGPTNVVAEGSGREVPSDEELVEIGREAGATPFVFTRPIEMSPDLVRG